MHGFIYLDKPKGRGSFECVRDLRRIFNIKRIGFLGTLDPLATGLLIFAVGESTKFIPYLEGLDKTYEVDICLGAISDTYDSDGSIEIFENPEIPIKDNIDKVIKSDFLGEREQIPPIFSAIHINGKRAYEYARNSEKVEMKSRKVKFVSIDVTSYDWPNLSLTVHCGNGTYVRSLVHDLGQKLSCGGYVKDLRRTTVGDFTISKAVKLEDINSENIERFLVPPEDVFTDWKKVDLNDKQYEVLKNGGFLIHELAGNSELMLALYNGECIGILESKGNSIKFKKRLLLSG